MTILSTLAILAAVVFFYTSVFFGLRRGDGRKMLFFLSASMLSISFVGLNLLFHTNGSSTGWYIAFAALVIPFTFGSFLLDLFVHEETS